MAKHKIKIRNCAGGLWWVTRPVSKMNNNLLNIFKKKGKRFAKRYSSKKTRVFLKDEMNNEMNEEK